MNDLACKDASHTPPKASSPWELYSSRSRRTFLLVLFLVGTLSYIDKGIIGVLLEPIKEEFHASDKMLGLLSGITFAVFYSTLGVPVARWADRGDRRLVITLSLAVWSVMTALCGVASTFWRLAAARIAVGAGEAGALPAAQSLIADYYPPTARSRAIAIFMQSGTAGYSIALVLGGFMAQNYGWRSAFVSVGLAGLVFTPLVNLILKEPRRSAQFAFQRDWEESGARAVRILLSKPAYRNVLGSIVLYYFMSYGVLVFMVPFIMRVHSLSVSQAGALYGTIGTGGSILGALGGGMLADRLVARDLAWLARVASCGFLGAVPLYELAFWSSNITAMLPALFLAITVLSAAVAPMFSALHIVCGSKRRALSVAAALFVANLVGFGLGPVTSGALSDWLGALYGTGEGLRYSLMIMIPLLLPAGWLMLRAGRHLKVDAED